MSKIIPYSPLAFGISMVAIAAIIASCQPNKSTNRAENIAISHLRSQLNIPAQVAIAVESQSPQLMNVSDLCQTTLPNQDGLKISLISEDIRYILHSDKDGNRAEICSSEDAKPESTTKYMGAGYSLRYPAQWRAIDLGLESSGVSTVIFTPSRDLGGGVQDLDKIRQQLRQNQQPHAIILRQPVNAKAIAPESIPEGAEKEAIVKTLDAQVKGAKSATQKEFTADNWQVKILTFTTDQFVYTVSYYQPIAVKDTEAFDQFAKSFALVDAP
jgi:hypothetical protein